MFLTNHFITDLIAGLQLFANNFPATFANFLPVYFEIMEEGIGVLRTLALTP